MQHTIIFGVKAGKRRLQNLDKVASSSQVFVEITEVGVNVVSKPESECWIYKKTFALNLNNPDFQDACLHKTKGQDSSGIS